jgi:hypothetical protein
MALRNLGQPHQARPLMERALEITDGRTDQGRSNIDLGE